MTGSEDHEVPGRSGGDRFKEQGHFSAAGHADVALEVPAVDDGGWTGGKKSGGFGKDSGFDFPAANGAGVAALGGGDELRPDVGRCAAAGLDDGDHDGVPSLAMQAGGFLPRFVA